MNSLTPITMHKKQLVTGMLASVMIVAIGFALSPVQEASAEEKEPSIMPETQWFSLKGIKLKNGEFLDLVDTTPRHVTDGHVALYVPCDNKGNSKLQLLQGTVDSDVNTLAPVELEFIESLSDPGKSCLYHADIGSDTEVITDFAIINQSGNPVIFRDRNTIAFTIAETV